MLRGPHHSPGKEIEILNALSESMLYKDLLSFRGIRKPDLLENLLRALALQTGEEVSFNELSSLLQVDKNTVMTYVNLLEQAYIIFRLSPLSRNLRNEILIYYIKFGYYLYYTKSFEQSFDLNLIQILILKYSQILLLSKFLKLPAL